jgi:hypothetical protein
MGDGIDEVRMQRMQGNSDSDMKPPMVSAFSKKRYAVNEQTMTYGNKHAHLIKTMKPMSILSENMTAREKAKGDVMRPGPGNTDRLIWMKGEDLEGIELNYTWGFYKKPGIWHRGPGKSDGAHFHNSDEVLVFAGTDPGDINYLGAEISIDMGEERERYVFDKPTAVVCPKGTVHAPIITRYVDRPFAFFMMNLAAEYEITYV